MDNCRSFCDSRPENIDFRPRIMQPRRTSFSPLMLFLAFVSSLCWSKSLFTHVFKARVVYVQREGDSTRWGALRGFKKYVNVMQFETEIWSKTVNNPQVKINPQKCPSRCEKFFDLALVTGKLEKGRPSKQSGISTLGIRQSRTMSEDFEWEACFC